MSRPAKSVYLPKKNTDQWVTAAESCLTNDLRLLISRSKDNFYAKFLIHDNKNFVTKIPIRAEVQAAIKEKKAGVINHEKGKYSVTPDSKGVKLQYTPVGGSQKSIHIPNDGLELFNATMGLFDFFMRDDERLELTVARLIYEIDDDDSYDDMVEIMEEKTGMTIKWKSHEVSNSKKLPEDGENRREAMRFLHSFYPI